LPPSLKLRAPSMDHSPGGFLSDFGRCHGTLSEPPPWVSKEYHPPFDPLDKTGGVVEDFPELEIPPPPRILSHGNFSSFFQRGVPKSGAVSPFSKPFPFFSVPVLRRILISHRFCRTIGPFPLRVIVFPSLYGVFFRALEKASPPPGFRFQPGPCPSFPKR